MYAVDRFEETKAVLQDDDGASVIVERALLPIDVTQGDILILCNGRYEHDRAETIARRDRIHRLEQLLRGKNKGKDA